MAVQTPKQRIANERFAKRNEKKLGKAKPKETKVESPLSKTWVIVLLFLLVGGGILELFTLFM
ncbi:LAQU0S16e01750g1_1 [Lachancea quebecensis]|uniref:Stress-associated endoplasmic reticulum protein n=1 Tax=Lachancea quebecensis TaxID=1654605 RepID=A0A0P1KWB7_9SACH|nr:LAQU0S16e01750g1_1 [Lachancea quebecensis]